MRMLAIGIVLPGLVGDVTPAFAPSRAKQCRRSCADAIAQCARASGGDANDGMPDPGTLVRALADTARAEE